MLALQEVVDDIAAETKDEAFDIVEDLKTGVSDFVGDMMEFLPKLIGFIAILVIGMFVAKLIGRAVRKLLKKINFDYYMDKAGVGAPLERAGFKDSGRFAGKIIYYLIVLLVLKMAFDVLDIQALEDPFNKLIEWIPKAIIALVLVVIGGIVANTVRDLVKAATQQQGYSNLVTKVAFAGVWVIFGLAALDQIEIGADVIDTLTTVLFSSLGAIIVIKYGVGGIWAARDRFWPSVYDSIGSSNHNAPPPEHR